jgi:hypothetical protein
VPGAVNVGTNFISYQPGDGIHVLLTGSDATGTVSTEYLLRLDAGSGKACNQLHTPASARTRSPVTSHAGNAATSHRKELHWAEVDPYVKEESRETFDAIIATPPQEERRVADDRCHDCDGDHVCYSRRFP